MHLHVAALVAPVHVFEAGHAAPVLPHTQPDAVQMLEDAPVQLAQVTPLRPQVLTLCVVTHDVPLQQPVHVAGSQVQAPATQRRPVAQGALAPQPQVPLVRQLSDRASQVPQVPPFGPQAVVVLLVTQVVPWQQPPPQELEVQMHAPPWQRWPGAQLAPVPQRHAPLPQLSLSCVSQPAHAAPAVPQEPVVVAVMHDSPLQQPVAQDVPSQTHWTPLQREPAGQLVAVHAQVPPWHSWVAPQAELAPQRQPPLVQLSARSASQVVHEPPAVPQVAGEAVRHWPS